MAMEASELERAAQDLPSAESLVALAQRRLSAELRALPPEGSAAWRAALLAEARPATVSFGALAHAIRVTSQAGRMAEAQALFVALLRRIDGLNRRWVASVLWPLHGSAIERHEQAQDLNQDLTLLLWERIGLGDDEAWELFFQRALAFAQSHVAKAYLRRQGLRAGVRSVQAMRGLTLEVVDLAAALEDGAHAAMTMDAAVARADLADLRALALRLPERERLAIVMRFWQQASEAEIARALGGVSTRAVRYTLRRAYVRLRAWYAGEQEHTGDVGEETDGD